MAARGPEGGDFYAVLGLSKECSDADLRNAYKKLALRWHPDRCSAAPGNSKALEEAKEKFQEIHAAYSVLSDSNKRFLYDVGVFDSHDNDEENEGMGEFLGELAQMLSQIQPSQKGHESLEELQQLFVDMFQADLEMDLNGGPNRPKCSATNGCDRPFSSPSSSTCPHPHSSRSGGSGSNKRGSAIMISSSRMAKPKMDELDPDSAGFCFGLSGSGEPSRGRGGSKNGRRSRRKQKVTSKHDVSSQDAKNSNWNLTG